VTLVNQGHISLKTWKLIARTVSPTPSLFVAQRPSTYSQWNMGKFWETRGVVGKSGVLNTEVAISLKRVKINEKLLWTAYRNSPMLFRTVPSPTPRFGVCNLNPKLQSVLSHKREKLRTANMADTFTGSIQTNAREKFEGAWAYPGSLQCLLPKFLECHLLSQERVKLQTSNLAATFTVSIRTKAHYKFGRKGSVGISRAAQIF